LIVDFLASKTDDTAVSPEGVLEPAMELTSRPTTPGSTSPIG
jgi:hypothetical protein